MLNIKDQLMLRGKIEIIAYERGKKKPLLEQETENIILNNGRQFLFENIAASSFGVGTFTRTQNSVVRYIGVGIGGDRQTAPEASASPLADSYPGGYGGTNTQNDSTLSVGRLERPVKATNALWMKEVAAPATFPTATSVRWEALFTETDVNLAPYTAIPITEIALYRSLADPSLPNGGAGAYPGPTNHAIAYDTFYPLYKTAFFNFLVRWTWTS